jgi:hypothetical protein
MDAAVEKVHCMDAAAEKVDKLRHRKKMGAACVAPIDKIERG